MQRYADEIVGQGLRQSLYLLLAAVGMVLLIGCANLANLTLARATSREREVAIRSSLGAGRGRLVRQFLTENVLLALCGGSLGLGLGYLMMQGLQAAIPPNSFPRESHIVMDTRVLLFTLARSRCLRDCIFGLAPALRGDTARSGGGR